MSMIVLLCGLSGAGKTTLAIQVKSRLVRHGKLVELIDGDEYRETLCHDLGFSKKERYENIRRLGFVAEKLSKYGVISIISAICPYEAIRNELKMRYKNVYIVYVNCPIEILLERDTKGLYRRALLPDDHPKKIKNLTGINDEFEIPHHPDLYLDTGTEAPETSTNRLYRFIRERLTATEMAFANSHNNLNEV